MSTLHAAVKLRACSSGKIGYICKLYCRSVQESEPNGIVRELTARGSLKSHDGRAALTLAQRGARTR